mmetsp:Transcript_11230/g.24773  ORF Transcript_11230/g.24773 Transcript_11230/m.24773 type:complete len:541 (+) Transcript_11230:82-1704(+)
MSDHDDNEETVVAAASGESGSSDDDAPLMPLASKKRGHEELSAEEEDDDDDDDAQPPPHASSNIIKGIDFSKSKEELIDAMNPVDNKMFRQADNRRNVDNKALRDAHLKMIRAKAESEKLTAKYTEAQRAYQEIKDRAESHVLKDADALLLEPTPWNTYYKQLKAFFDREGHSNFKRTITDADVVGMSDEAEKELRTLSWWTCRQRKFKRRGELEQYKIILLDRLNFNWDPHAGPGPEKWLRSFALLKEFNEQNGHCKVPVKYVENDQKLGSWLKTQVTQYRNAQEGRQPALSAERIRLLEEVGVVWGVKRLTTPWENRFADLLEFKRAHGHCNVPWQWKENIPLAQWVNSQRKKYKDLMDGKRNNLAEEHINKLNDIGFKWNTGGRGRYAAENGMGPIQAESNNFSGAASANSNEVSSDTRAAAAALLQGGNAFGGVSSNNMLGTNNGAGRQDGQLSNFMANSFNRGNFEGMGGNNQQLMNEHALNNYVQRLAHQNQHDMSYFTYAYQLNQLNNPSSQISNQMNQMFASGNGGEGGFVP